MNNFVELAVAGIFVVGYFAIALEHRLHLNKAASALMTGILCWTLYALNAHQSIPQDQIPSWFAESLGGESGSHDLVRAWLLERQLGVGLGEIAGVLFFLLGAMTIVEVVDAFEGFQVITTRINTTSRRKLLWVVSILTFFLSTVLDNLTTTIVMVALVRKLVKDQPTRWMLAGMIVCAANAGGAWTVIGDVTTTMLWIKNKISPVHVMSELFLPSIACLLAPLVVSSFLMKGNVERPNENDSHANGKTIPRHLQVFVLVAGFLGLLSVPFFKMITHLPPFMGILLSLSVVWIAAELARGRLDDRSRSSTHILDILRKVDTSSILFFLGILLAINCLSSMGMLTKIAHALDQTVGNESVICVVIGLVSSIVDNVPLVAAGIEMYPHEMDNPFWVFLAYCTGTGGSCLIIGSAAGVAAMGLEHIDFMWYLKRISPIALLGYLAGVGVHLMMKSLGF
ncbi:MAG: sodium:proton antiporter NhaD [Pirellulaceae bacterium]